MFVCPEYKEKREKLKMDLADNWKDFKVQKHFNGKTLVFGFVRKLCKGEKREVNGPT